MSDQERTSSSESFSGRIKLVRYSFDLSQREVAEIAGTFIQNVSRWEKKTFEPSAEVKKRIAEALNLSVSWLISGAGFPFQTGVIAHLKPKPKHVFESFQLLNIAITRSNGAKAFYYKAIDKDYYYLHLDVKESDGSIISILIPVGHEELIRSLLKLYPIIKNLGGAASLDEEYAKQYQTSFPFVMERIRYYEAKILESRSEILNPEDYFFAKLYNISKDEIIRVLNSFRDKEQSNDLLASKINDFLVEFDRHHTEFKNIVRKWIENKPFTKVNQTILERFIGQSKVLDILNLHDKYNWETDLTKGILEDSLMPFALAYKEIIRLVLAEGQGMTVIRPKIDESNDKLYWRERKY